MATPAGEELLHQAARLRAQLVAASEELSMFTDALRRAMDETDDRERDDDDSPH